MAIWGCGSPARCCQPAVAGGFIYANLRSELSTHLVPAGFVYLEFSWAWATATSFPFSKHTGGGDTAPAFSGLRVYLQFTLEVGFPPSPVEFSSHSHFYKLSHSWVAWLGGRLVGSQAGGLAGWQVVAWLFYGVEAWWACVAGAWRACGVGGEGLAGLRDGSGMGACLFFQCIMAWRVLPWARGSGCWSFSSPWCFISAKCVSCISARSLIHGAHAVCIYVPVAILDLPANLFLEFTYLVFWMVLFILLLFSVLGFKLRVLCLLGNHIPTSPMPPRPFALVYFSDRVSCFYQNCSWNVILLPPPPE
jgi:hypothetical protein